MTTDTLLDARVFAESLMSIYESGHGTGPDGCLTWDEYLSETAGLRTRVKDWSVVAAWLAAQLVGSQALVNADAHQVLLNIAREVHRFEDTRRVPPPEEPTHGTPDMLALLTKETR